MEVKKIRKKLALVSLTIFLAIGMASLSTAEREDSAVTVDVSSDVAVDVQPSQLNYNQGVEPGNYERVDDEGNEQLEIRNIGSEPLDEIYAEVTKNSDNPFGTSANIDHNTGGFVQLWTETAQEAGYDLPGLTSEDTPHYVTRTEHEIEPVPTYLDIQESNLDIDATEYTNENQAVGRHRVGDVEYYFVVFYEDALTDVVVMVGQTPHTPTELGTTDFTEDSDDVVVYTDDDELTQDGDVYEASGQDLVAFDTSVYEGEPTLDDNGDADIGGDPIEGHSDTEIRQYVTLYDLADSQDFRQAVRTAWEVNLEPADGGWDENDLDESTGTAYIYDSGSSDPDDAVQPDENFPVDVGVEVPLGVDRDQIQEGSVTIVASEFSG